MSGVFPTFSKDGSKLAFVDNEFKALWVADSKGLRVVYSVYHIYMYLYICTHKVLNLVSDGIR